jgi:hypothetical protein
MASTLASFFLKVLNTQLESKAVYTLVCAWRFSFLLFKKEKEEKHPAFGFSLLLAK